MCLGNVLHISVILISDHSICRLKQSEPCGVFNCLMPIEAIVLWSLTVAEPNNCIKVWSAWHVLVWLLQVHQTADRPSHIFQGLTANIMMLFIMVGWDVNAMRPAFWPNFGQAVHESCRRARRGARWHKRHFLVQAALSLLWTWCMWRLRLDPDQQQLMFPPLLALASA